MLTEYKRELLTKARELLREESYGLICFAIREADNYSKSEAAKKLMRFISKALEPRQSYEGWVFENHPEEFKEMGANDFRAGRIAWINYLLDLPPEDDITRVYPHGKYRDVGYY